MIQCENLIPKKFLSIDVRAFFLIFNLVVSVSFFAFSQEKKIGIDPETSLKSLSMDQWTVRDGLISSTLTSVRQTSSKFLWITSFNGILRFDGVNFKLFDKNNLPFLNSNGFYWSYEDSKGNLWFASQSSGIIKFSNNKFQQVLTNDSIKVENSLSVRCLEEDSEGRIWVGTNNKGVYMLEDTVLVKVDLGEWNTSSVMDIESDGDGKMWFATNGKGVLIYEDQKVKNFTTDSGLNHNTVNRIILSEDGKMYAGTIDGIYYFGKEGNGRLRQFDGLEINDIFFDDYQNLWAGSEQGLFRMNLATESFDSFTQIDGLPSSQISSLYFDHENSLWVSTKKAGLIRFNDGFFKNISVEEGLSSNSVNIIVENNKSFYVGNDDGSISIVRGNKARQLDLKSTVFNIGIRDINFGDDDEILVANYRGLIVIKDGKERMIDLNDYDAGNDIRRVLRGADGTIWLGTRSSGVVKYEDANNVTIINSKSGIESDYILAIEENSNGDIYVGTHSGGLSIISKNGEISNNPIEGGKSGILIFNLQIMENGDVWVATNIGIYKFKNGAFSKILLDKNLKAETIFDIVLENENAWLSSNIGLIHVSIVDLELFIEGKIDAVSGRLFDRWDGMASQECTGATRMTLSKDGNLWVPTLGGVAILNPNNIVKNDQIPQVYITDFKTDFHERELVPTEEIIIEPGIVRYEFNFTSLSYIAPPKVRFKYKLSDIDDDWIDAGSEREVVYTHLPKGEHVFNVIASNNDGVWNENGAALKFYVEPFFYQTILFYVLIIICIGLIIWGIFVWRLHNVERVNSELRKLNEELDRFVYSASHDLRAPLSSVLGLAEIARLEPTIEGKNECLRMINSSIKKLDGFINDIIDFSRNQRVELQVENLEIAHEANEVLNELKYLNTDEKIKISVSSEDNPGFLSDGRRLQVILKNLVSNAFRYHDLRKDNPFIKIDIKYQTDEVIISVSDNGIGIDKKHLDNIFKMFYRADESSKGSGLGLYIVIETLDKINGKIEVSSKLSEGTKFTLTMPSLKPTA